VYWRNDREIVCASLGTDGPPTDTPAQGAGKPRSKE
jgi:hypothetical protein